MTLTSATGESRASKGYALFSFQGSYLLDLSIKTRSAISDLICVF